MGCKVPLWLHNVLRKGAHNFPPAQVQAVRVDGCQGCAEACGQGRNIASCDTYRARTLPGTHWQTA